MVGRLALRQHDGADHRDQQQNRRQLERQQEVGEEALARRASVAAVARPAPRRRVPTGAPRTSDRRARPRAASAAEPTPAPRSAMRAAARAPDRRLQIEQHDDEEEEHHDRAGVDDDLQRRDHVGVEQHERPPPAGRASTTSASALLHRIAVQRPRVSAATTISTARTRKSDGAHADQPSEHDDDARSPACWRAPSGSRYFQPRSISWS